MWLHVPDEYMDSASAPESAGSDSVTSDGQGLLWTGADNGGDHALED